MENVFLKFRIFHFSGTIAVVPAITATTGETTGEMTGEMIVETTGETIDETIITAIRITRDETSRIVIDHRITAMEVKAKEVSNVIDLARPRIKVPDRLTKGIIPTTTVTTADHLNQKRSVRNLVPSVRVARPDQGKDLERSR